MLNKGFYSETYLKNRRGPFSMERVLDNVRSKKIIEFLKKNRSVNILDIGCGPFPLFSRYDSFESYTAIEASQTFFEGAVRLAKKHSSRAIHLYYGKMEEIASSLPPSNYDAIIVSSLLHEVPNPEVVVRVIRTLCNRNTAVIANVPNAKSIHRMLAFESGLIDSPCADSLTDRIYKRSEHFDNVTFKNLFTRNGFKIIDSYTYFIKLFSNKQLEMIYDSKVLDKKVFKGFEKMSKHLPDFGAELFLEAKILE